MRTPISIVLAGLLAIFMVACPLAYQRWQSAQFRNFRVVEPGVLYRSGQLSVARLEEIVAEHGIRTVISLRDGDAAIDQAEENWVKARKLHFVRLPHQSWWPDASGHVPADNVLAAFRKVMDDPANHPVLVHCFAGIHRTGTMVAVFRMDYQGWSNAEAMAEMRLMGYTILEAHEDVHSYMTKYRPPQRAKEVSALPVAHKKNPLP